MVARPKPATAKRSARPAFFMGGRWAMTIAPRSAPKAAEARSQPKPVAPAWRMLVAKMGRM